MQRDAAAVRIFPPAIPLLTVLIGIGVNHRLARLASVLRLLLCSGIGVGGFIRGVPPCLGWVCGRSEFSTKDRTKRKPVEADDPDRQSRGPFRITRNPMYLQIVLVCAGIAVLLDNLWILILTPVCAWLLQTLAIVPEERYLERKFGESLSGVQEPGSSLARDLSVRTIRCLCGMVCRNAGCARYCHVFGPLLSASETTSRVCASELQEQAKSPPRF